LHREEAKVMEENIVTLAYGRTGLPLKMDPALADWTVIMPREDKPPQPFETLFRKAAESPIGTRNLRNLIKPGEKVVIVTADSTRPVPNSLLIPALVEFCRLNYEDITILIGTGTHRPGDAAELEEILGPDIPQRCKVIWHDAANADSCRSVGKTPQGMDVALNSNYLEAGKKISLGFIEPHFFAGYSGGAKGICPGIASVETIDHFHSYEIIGHPKTDYGILEGNPQQEAARAAVRLAPPDVIINVTLNSAREVTGVFIGNFIEAHRSGCQRVKRNTLVPVKRKFQIVITTNAGYPQDQNLYQSVKGLAAAARIVEEGGTIILASECSRGIPSDGKFAEILKSRKTADEILELTSAADYKILDRWQAQKLALILKKSEILIYTDLDKKDVAACKLKKIGSLQETLEKKLKATKKKESVAVLPLGPLTVPVVA